MVQIEKLCYTKKLKDNNIQTLFHEYGEIINELILIQVLGGC